MDVADLGRILLVSALFALYFALWCRIRVLALSGARASRLATITPLAALVLAVGALGRRIGRAQVAPGS